MRINGLVIAVVVLAGLASSCHRVGSEAEPWPYSDVYRGLTPLSEDGAKERAIRECELRLGLTNAAAIAVLPLKDQVDYFRVLVLGKLNNEFVTNSVLIHRFNFKGDKIEKTRSQPDTATADPPSS